MAQRNSLRDVYVVMGSDSDFDVMNQAIIVLEDLGVSLGAQVLSAHRTPFEMLEFAKSARENGIKVIIAGAGGAAHLPGMIASATTLPVIGVPIKLDNLEGLDSLLSIVQMPSGVPVATVGINNAKNAGLLAARILACSDKGLSDRLSHYQHNLAQASLSKHLPWP